MNLKHVHKIRKYIHKHFNHTSARQRRVIRRERMNGKGDKQRPTDKSKFDANFDAIFRKPKNKSTDKSKGNKDERQKTV